MNRPIFVALIVALFIVGCARGCMGDPVEPAPAPGPVVEPPAPSAASTADKVVVKGDKRVRIVGVKYDDADKPIDGALGNVVEKPAAVARFEQNALCHVLIAAAPVVVNKKNLPDAPTLFSHITAAYMLPGTCNQDDCVWDLLLRPADCLLAVDLPGYLGSTMREFRALPMDTQARFLRTFAMVDTVIGGETISARQVVPVNFEGVLQNARVFVPHAWSGRFSDLNFVEYDKGTEVYTERK